MASDMPSSGNMPSSFDDDRDYQESGTQKVMRKLREEPLIPLGCALTVTALWNAFKATRVGDHARVQRMFRARVYAQGFTVLAIVAGGFYYSEDRAKTKELRALESQRAHEDRHAKWLRELEARDQEERDFQEAVRRKRQRVEARKAGAGAAAAAEEGEQVAAEEGVASTKEVLPEPTGIRRRVDDEIEGKARPDGQEAHAPKVGGGGVLGALSEAGGWFGTKKKDESESGTPESEEPKK